MQIDKLVEEHRNEIIKTFCLNCKNDIHDTNCGCTCREIRKSTHYRQEGILMKKIFYGATKWNCKVCGDKFKTPNSRDIHYQYECNKEAYGN